MTAGTEATWESGRLRVSELSGTRTFIFDSIRREGGTDTGNARVLVGNSFAGDALVKLTGVGITFIEESLNGSPSFTTVFASVTPATQRFIAVKSAHSMLPDGRLSPEQYHGTCAILQ